MTRTSLTRLLDGPRGLHQPVDDVKQQPEPFARKSHSALEREHSCMYGVLRHSNC